MSMKMKDALIAALICLVSVATTVYVCDRIVLHRSIGANWADLSLYTMTETYDNLHNELGDIITKEDFDKSCDTGRNGALNLAAAVETMDDGSILVIEYYETHDLLGGYGIQSVKVFSPDEKEELLKFLCE